jgi:hypothetical protein
MKQCHLQLAIFFSDRFGEDYLKWEAIDTWSGKQLILYVNVCISLEPDGDYIW